MIFCKKRESFQIRKYTGSYLHVLRKAVFFPSSVGKSQHSSVPLALTLWPAPDDWA